MQKRRSIVRNWEEAVKQRSFRTVDSPDFIVEAVRNAKMDKQHNHLNRRMRPSKKNPDRKAKS